jgi:hypothetical protein
LNITIQVLSTSLTNKTSARGTNYEELEIAYRDLSNSGKVSSKKLMPFGAGKDAFTSLRNAKPVEIYDVEVVKGEKYWDWIKVTKGTATTAPSTSTSGVGTAGHATTSNSTTTKGGWETPEERAKKQIYIVRQSSLANAVAALSAGAKAPLKGEAVIELAQQFEKYVFSVDTPEAVASKDVGSIETMEEDPLPF